MTWTIIADGRTVTIYTLPYCTEQDVRRLVAVHWGFAPGFIIVRSD